MIQYDFHSHCRYSGDSEAEPEAIILRAMELGLKGMCFTDHMDLEFPCIEEAGTDFLFDMDAYYSELSKLKERYGERFEVLIGMEAGIRNEDDLVERLNPAYNELAKRYQLDFVIGSTHCLEYTDPYCPKPYWEGKSEQKGIETYFRAVLENIVNYDCFDSVGHMDYLVRYIPKEKQESMQNGIVYSPWDYADVIDEILRTIISRGIALECNTAGLKYGLGFAHPHDYILKRYRDMGGELLTIGSDGHIPDHIAFGFEETCNHLKELGFSYYTVYRNRKPEFVRL